VAAAADTRTWYATLNGRRAARRLARVIAPTVRLGPTARLLALGYAPPLLMGLDPARLERLAVALTGPGPGTAHHWPARGGNHALAADAARLPFAAGLFDQALVVHALEHAEEPRAVLRELWRVLAPAGELIVLVPNRLGRWLDPGSPFARGRAYGHDDLDTLLREAMFEPRSQRAALGPGGGVGRVRLALAAKVDGFAPTMVGLAEPMAARRLAPA